MSDNFHQSVNGGTGANHIMFGHADAIWFSNADGKPGRAAETRAGVHGYDGAANPDRASSMRSRIPIRRPAPTTGTPRTATATATMPAIRRPTGPPGLRRRFVQRLLRSEPARREADPRLSRLAAAADRSALRAGHYYLLNNYNPGYFGNGKNAYIDTNPGQHAVHHSALVDAQHRRRPERPPYLLEVLRRSVEQLRQRSVPDQLRNAGTRRR
jgi:phospholipase C